MSAWTGNPWSSELDRQDELKKLSIVSFDATDWSIDEIRNHARRLGWKGCHINIQRLLKGDGKCIVTRTSGS